MQTRIVTTVLIIQADGAPKGQGCSILCPGDKDNYNLGVAIATGRAVKDWWEREQPYIPMGRISGGDGKGRVTTVEYPTQSKESAVKLSFKNRLPDGPPDGLSFAPVG